MLDNGKNNLNTGFYKNLDTNFEQALVMADKEFSHDEIFDLLKYGNIPQKQIAALKLDTINSKEEADILVSNLTGCDGKIREAVALKINQLLQTSTSTSHYFTQADIFANASIDINANICRLAIESASVLIKDNAFATNYSNKIFEFIYETFDELDKFIFRDKKYVINKQLFKLYWCLEALKLFANTTPTKILLPILNRTAKEKEYTIREKTAQILSNLQSLEYDTLKKQLQQDENYYVREVMKQN